ncbi:DUF5758 domain-containing protein [Lichenihabitans sp. Uapishka_5]|uniref:DUF5758 domain-containing protein n=1 Tax=Lichenihabitans sp. Uapishka_5 TaxID=3037302 RepID=UPI0029E81FC8|nr:DUF5758 domain-containing protein [Lichenihabitans sp. Uapishka_5]MDX7950478.1 DUF5758 domain-containing protein [Lichenihabitans sp. Uapishka_5]
MAPIYLTTPPALPLQGVLSGNSVSPSFTPYPDYTNIPDFDHRSVHSWGTVQLTYPSPLTGTVTITRSTDGSVYSPLTSLIDGSILSQVSTLGASANYRMHEYDKDASWRIECNLSAGSIKYACSGDVGSLTPQVWANIVCPQQFDGVRYSQSQLNAYKALLQTPVKDSDLVGNIVLYKRCHYNTFAKLSVPAAAKRRRGGLFIEFFDRDICAEYADVVSIVDRLGNPFSSAPSISYRSFIYTTGQRAVASNLDTVTSPNDFMSPYSQWGIHGYLSLMEAVRYSPDLEALPVNFQALGL